jgi:hypothetical protein
MYFSELVYRTIKNALPKITISLRAKQNDVYTDYFEARLILFYTNVIHD